MDAKEALAVLLNRGIDFANEQAGEVAVSVEAEVLAAHTIVLAALEAK